MSPFAYAEETAALRQDLDKIDRELEWLQTQRAEVVALLAEHVPAGTGVEAQ